MLPSSQSPGLQLALNAPFAMLPLHPPRIDIRLFTHTHKWPPICSVAFAAEIVQWPVCIVHSHITDQIQPQTCHHILNMPNTAAWSVALYITMSVFACRALQ